MNLISKVSGLRCAENLLYVDRAVIIINKPAGLVTQLDNTRDAQKLADLLEELKCGLDLPNTPHGVHRLDKGTTGCLVFGRSSSAAHDMTTQFKKRSVEKTYLALVRGGRESFPENSGQIRVPLRYEDGRGSLASSGELEDAKESATDWELVASSPHLPLSLLRLKLITGHKHQLRLHLAHALNTPILGDTFYSHTQPTAEIRNRVTLPEDRMFLHASQISFFRWRPEGSHRRFRLRIFAPLPLDFLRLCTEANIPVGENERLGGLFMRTGKDPNYEDVVNGEIPDVGGYWIPRYMQ